MIKLMLGKKGIMMFLLDRYNMKIRENLKELQEINILDKNAIKNITFLIGGTLISGGVAAAVVISQKIQNQKQFKLILQM